MCILLTPLAYVVALAVRVMTLSHGVSNGEMCLSARLRQNTMQYQHRSSHTSLLGRPYAKVHNIIEPYHCT